MGKIKLEFKSGLKHNAPRIPKKRWEEYKELLCSLCRENTVAQVVAFMKTEHDFVVNPGQLGRKLRGWSFHKYDTKKRASTALRSDPDGFNVPHSGQSSSFGANLPDTLAETPSTMNKPARVPHMPVDICTPDASSMCAKAPQASLFATTPLSDSSGVVESTIHPLALLPGHKWPSLISLLDGYADALDLVERMQGKGHETGLAKHGGLLMRLTTILRLYQEAIQQLYLSDLRKLGEEYAWGDSEAIVEMNRLSTMQHNIVLPSLQRALADHANFPEKCPFSALGKSTLDALVCLHRLSCRISAAYDIDMERFSTSSQAPSSSSSFAAFRSFARRIKNPDYSRGTNSTDELSWSAMSESQSATSFQIFKRLSTKSSIASSIRTGASRMSWRLQTSHSLQEEDGAVEA